MCGVGTDRREGVKPGVAALSLRTAGRGRLRAGAQLTGGGCVCVCVHACVAHKAREAWPAGVRIRAWMGR